MDSLRFKGPVQEIWAEEKEGNKLSGLNPSEINRKDDNISSHLLQEISKKKISSFTKPNIQKLVP